MHSTGALQHLHSSGGAVRSRNFVRIFKPYKVISEGAARSRKTTAKAAVRSGKRSGPPLKSAATMRNKEKQLTLKSVLQECTAPKRCKTNHSIEALQYDSKLRSNSKNEQIRSPKSE